MKLTIIFVSLAFCFYSCTNKAGVKKIQLGDLILEGAITIKGSDTIFNGEIKYYNRNNKLISKIHYLNGQKNGTAVNFHPNGAIHEESSYVLGLINGFRFTYDLNEKIESKDYYYYGARIGPLVVYENGIVKEYYFSDFEGHTLFSSSYDSLGNLKEKSKEYFYLTTLKGQNDSKSGLFLFLYLLNPPKMKLDYRFVSSPKSRPFEIRDYSLT